MVDGLKEWAANDSGDDLERKINRELSMGTLASCVTDVSTENNRD